MGIPFMIFLAAVGAIVVFVIVSYNRLVSLTQRSQSAWSDVDVQLKRRTDLVPNLVESVKGYASHERGTLDAVVRDLNTAIQEFPSNLVAGFFQFRPHAYFELDRPEDRQVPKVSFGG